MEDGQRILVCNQKDLKYTLATFRLRKMLPEPTMPPLFVTDFLSKH